MVVNWGLVLWGSSDERAQPKFTRVGRGVHRRYRGEPRGCARPGAPGARAVPVHRGGRGGTGGPLTMRGSQIVLTRLGQKTGIHVHPHRHTFVTRALSALASTSWLCSGRWGTPRSAMVSRYVHHQRSDLLEASAAYRPDDGSVGTRAGRHGSRSVISSWAGDKTVNGPSADRASIP